MLTYLIPSLTTQNERDDTRPIGQTLTFFAKENFQREVSKLNETKKKRLNLQKMKWQSSTLSSHYSWDSRKGRRRLFSWFEPVTS